MLEQGKPTTSTRCCGSQCVEVTALGDVVQVRDKKPGGGTTSFTAADWRRFAAAVERGEFDD